MSESPNKRKWVRRVDFRKKSNDDAHERSVSSVANVCANEEQVQDLVVVPSNVEENIKIPEKDVSTEMQVLSANEPTSDSSREEVAPVQQKSTGESEEEESNNFDETQLATKTAPPESSSNKEGCSGQPEETAVPGLEVESEIIIDSDRSAVQEEAAEGTRDACFSMYQMDFDIDDNFLNSELNSDVFNAIDLSALGIDFCVLESV